MSKADIVFKNFVWSFELYKTTRFVSGKKEESYQVQLLMGGIYDKESKSQYIIHVSKEDYEALLKEEEINLDNEVGVKSNKVEIISSLLDQLSLDELRELRRISNEKIALLEVLEGEKNE